MVHGDTWFAPHTEGPPIDMQTPARPWSRGGDSDGSASERHPMQRTRPTPRSFALYTVVLANAATAEAVVLHAARTADQATIAFHQALQRVSLDRVVGELVVIHHDEHPRTLLRVPCGPGAGTPRS